MMRILITGVTGGIGSRLAPELLKAGHEVRGLTRRGELGTRMPVPPGLQLVTGDALSGAGLSDALRGVEVAYYLIHSMEPGDGEAFDERERRTAENFAAAARESGVGRIVYLGGLVPQPAPVAETVQLALSDHLASRLGVERILLAAVPNSVALRASIVIGSRSRSFRFLVRLVERLPALVIPAWGEHSTAPVDERDVTECLARSAISDAVAGRSLDVAGPETVTYTDLIERIRDHLLLSRPTVTLRGLTLTPIASRVSAVIASEEHALIGPLMEGLTTDLLPRAELATELLHVRRHALDSAIERALRDWELTEPLGAR
jgi:uncharacterized protein YbjT (DUF2867 family)